MKIRLCLLLAPFLAGCGLGPPTGTENSSDAVESGVPLFQWTQDIYSAVEAGEQLSHDEAVDLEQLLAAEPANQALRVKLIGYYFGLDWGSELSKRRAEHVLWLIKNQPEAKVLAIPQGEFDSSETAAYWEPRSVWTQHLERMPENLDVLRNAAKFFMLSERQLAIELLRRAQRIDPSNPEWASSLGQLYSFEAVGNRGEPDPNVAAEALIQYERAYELFGKADGDHLLGDLARAALVAGETEKAQAFADSMLSTTAKDWNFGNRVHHGHLTLGRIALAEGNVEEAKRRLLKAGETPGSPQLDSFGPNMSLAKDLLEKGEKEVVLKYFELCSKFWNSDDALEELADWTALVQGDRIPDFGANLDY